MNSGRQVSRNKPAGAVRIFCVGDVYSKPGVEALTRLLPGLLRSEEVDFCIANAENAEQGKGIQPRTVRQIFESGVDVLTGGNHSLYRDRHHDLYDDPRILRPHNFSQGTPGRGVGLFDCGAGRRIGVINLQGRAYMPLSDDPFRVGKAAAEKLQEDTSLIVVDFHAESTAEKIAFAKYMDGSVTAVFGTHTHVQTADAQILPEGTGYITDVGMTGSHAGVIGFSLESALRRFLTPTGGGRSIDAAGDEWLSGILIDADSITGKALDIITVRRSVE